MKRFDRQQQKSVYVAVHPHGVYVDCAIGRFSFDKRSVGPVADYLRELALRLEKEVGGNGGGPAETLD